MMRSLALHICGSAAVRLIACLFLAAVALPARAAVAAQPARPNVVLILSDDQHWRDYAFLGHAQLRTPALDRLAAESLVFTRGYVPSSLCCPSLASLITGHYPHEHLITGLLSLAHIRRDQGQKEQARALLERALAIYGPEHSKAEAIRQELQQL